MRAHAGSREGVQDTTRCERRGCNTLLVTPPRPNYAHPRPLAVASGRRHPRHTPLLSSLRPLEASAPQGRPFPTPDEHRMRPTAFSHRGVAKLTLIVSRSAGGLDACAGGTQRPRTVSLQGLQVVALPDVGLTGGGPSERDDAK